MIFINQLNILFTGELVSGFVGFATLTRVILREFVGNSARIGRELIGTGFVSQLRLRV
jgi:hypothetical protein